METAPKSLRLQIALFGRTNVGKSSLLNQIANQDIAITSPVPGTTTDVVEKAMEFLPLGPVVWFDTAGLDDTGTLGDVRIRKSRQIFNRADIIIIVCESHQWGEPEQQILATANERNIPVIAVANKTDLSPIDDNFSNNLLNQGVKAVIPAQATTLATRESFLAALKQALLNNVPEDFLKPPQLTGDLIEKGDNVILMVPIDIQAPKGRLILPEVHTIRDVLDNGGVVTVAKENDYQRALANMRKLPTLAVGDSQAVDLLVAHTPESVACTTFSILFSRLKGDMELMARGAAAVKKLRPGDRVLIAEACSHHASEDDIGRVKIPRWLQEMVHGELKIDVCTGRDFPDNLEDYQLVIHCGGCMLNRKEVLTRIQEAAKHGVPITNYGMCISVTRQVIERVLSPFPKALEAYLNALDT